MQKFMHLTARSISGGNELVKADKMLEFSGINKIESVDIVENPRYSRTSLVVKCDRTYRNGFTSCLCGVEFLRPFLWALEVAL